MRTQPEIGVTDLETLHPELALQLVDQSLGTKLLPKSNKKAEWRCSLQHVWEAVVSSRTAGAGCPFCSNKKVLEGFNDLGTLNPELASELDDPEISATEIPGLRSNKVVQWRCGRGHNWRTSVANRAKGTGCPICSGFSTLAGVNDIRTTHPEIAKELVNEVDGYKISSGSEKLVWWVCDKGHKWEAHAYNRVIRKFGCVYCSGQRLLVGFNDLATTHPELAKELVDTDILPTSVSKGSHKKPLWRCSMGHEWRAQVSSRTRGNGCSTCSTNQTSQVEGALRELLRGHYPNTHGDHKGRVPVVNYKYSSRSVDIILPLSNMIVVVEYDGWYWHQNKVAADTEKTVNLLDNGYTVVRLREGTRNGQLSLLDLEHPNLLQLHINYTPYSQTDDHLIEAVQQIKEWIDNHE